MNLKRVIHDTTNMLISFLTYQAVRTIIDQLSETNPPLAIWLRQFSSGDKLQDGDRYLQELCRERKDLGLRVMTVRQELAEKTVDFLPEMVRQGINDRNVDHRRQLLERMTQTQSLADLDSLGSTHPELRSEEAPPSEEPGSV